MKRIFLLYLLFICNFPSVLAAQQEEKTAVTALLSAAGRLETTGHLSYTYKREINNYNDHYFNKVSAFCYVDFKHVNEAGMFRFQFKSDSYAQIFNGTEYFELDKKEKTMQVTEKTSGGTFNSLSYFYNSLPTLRNMFRTLALDSTVEKKRGDTLIAGKAYEIIRLNMHNKAIDYLKGYRLFKIDMIIYYTVFIDQDSGLPYQVLESNSVDGDRYNTKTTFLNLSIQPVTPEQMTWYYSTYKKEYHPRKALVSKSLIRIGTDMEPWVLPLFAQHRDLSSKELSGKIVLMDFWIQNCGYCMASFPYLKALQEKYGKDNFQLVAVNAYDDRKAVGFFYEREKPDYLMAYNGRVLAEKLGIGSYPKVLLIDGDGKVIYAGDFDRPVVDQLIRHHLENKKTGEGR